MFAPISYCCPKAPAEKKMIGTRYLIRIHSPPARPEKRIQLGIQRRHARARPQGLWGGGSYELGGRQPTDRRNRSPCRRRVQLGFPRSTTAAVVRAPLNERWSARRNQRIYNGLRLAHCRPGSNSPNRDERSSSGESLPEIGRASCRARV